MIVIVDYGMGNLRSVQKAFEGFCQDVKVSSSSQDVLSADKVILPGVGAFGKAMEELKKRKLIKPIKEAISKGRPFLGICLGIQLLFSESDEGGKVKGLDVLKGKVKKLDSAGGLKIPHMGWNRIEIKDNGKGIGLMDGVPDGSYMYFVHSYYVEPQDENVILCKTEYGCKFVSGICKDNVYALQFHPEKSQGVGLGIVRNFSNL